MLEWFSMLFNELGQVGDDPDTGGSGEGDTGAPAAPQTPTDTDPDFVKPIEGLKPELQPEWEKHRRGMQSSYTKALNKIKERETELEEMKGRYTNVDRFYSDNNFAKETVELWAKNNGYQLTSHQQQQQANQLKVPDNVLEATRNALPDDLKWMADNMAKATWASLQQAVGPMLEKQQSDAQSRRATEVEDTLSQLSETDPGWEEYEDEMSELLEYLQSPALTHKTFGSKPKILLGLLKGEANAIREATSRMRNAAKHKSPTPSPGTGQSNIADRIRKAPTDREAWDLVRRRALGESS